MTAREYPASIVLMFAQGSVLLLIFVVFTSLILGGFLHAIVPHEHENESIWTTLHAALRHEEKYLALALAAVLLSELFKLPILTIRTSYAISSVLVPYVGRAERALHRGIVAYRRFG